MHTPTSGRSARSRHAEAGSESGAALRIGTADTGPRTGQPVWLRIADARHHIQVAGVTGTGKSTELLHVMDADARARRGFGLLDPNGDLARDLLDRLPASAGRRLVLIDPDEREAPPALNVLDTTGRDPELVTEHVVGVLHRLYGPWWGPRVEDTLRAACLTLTGYHAGATLADVPRLLTDAGFRRRITRRARVADPDGLGSFWDAYDTLSPAQAAQACGPVLSKLRAVLTRRFAADLFGVPASTFQPAQLLDSGGILIARLPKGVLGEDCTRLVGSLLLACLWQAALARSAQPEYERRDARVVIDECHNFLHLPIGVEDALAEARKLRVSFVLAHQHLTQLPPAVRDAVSANARNKIVFTVSTDDARTLAPYLGPTLAAEDLSRRAAFTACCRLVRNGQDTTGFTIATDPPPPPIPGRAEALREQARQRHGLPRAQRDELARRRRYLAASGTDPVPTPDRGADSAPGSVPTSVPGSLPGLETGSEPGTPDPKFPQISDPTTDAGPVPDWT